MINFFDAPVLYFINKTLSNPFFDFIMPVITVMGSGEFLFAVSILMLFSKKKETKMLGILIIAGLTISFYAVSVLKGVIARPRPFLALQDIVMRSAERSFSFPSNHASASFMAATLLSNRYRRHVIFYLLAILVCVSRAYLGVHYPSDVLAGAIIGTVIGYLLILIKRSIEPRL